MPGIVGLVTKRPREQALRTLQRMTTALCHESFYTTGMWTDESLGIYVGWAERGTTTLPIHSPRKDVVLAFSGEDTSELGCADHSRSYLVRQYQSDPRFPAGLNGRFHGLLVDRARKTATLFNDRYGMHRLYYHEARDAFYFAAEAKAILA